MVRILLYTEGRSTPEEVPLSALESGLGADRCAWVSADEAEEPAVEDLAPVLGLAPDRLAQALHPHRRSPVRRGGALFPLVLHVAVLSEEGLSLRPLSVLATERVLVTVGPGPSEALAGTRPCRGALSLLHALLDWLAMGYHESALGIDDEIDRLEGLLFGQSRQSSALQLRSYELHKRLALLRRAALPLREVVDDLPGEDFEDAALLLDHTIQSAEALREMLTSLLSVGLSLEQARLSVTMKKLTGWAAVIAVPTVITGWYGMNVPLPWQESLWGALLANTVLAVAAIAVYASFRRRDWL